MKKLNMDNIYNSVLIFIFYRTRKWKYILRKQMRQKALKDIVDEYDISLDSVILVKNGEVCLEDTTVCDKDKISILSVVSGG